MIRSIALKLVCALAGLLGVAMILVTPMFYAMSIIAHVPFALVAFNVAMILLWSLSMLLCSIAAWFRTRWVVRFAWIAVLVFIIGNLVSVTFLNPFGGANLSMSFCAVAAIQTIFVIFVSALAPTIDPPRGRA